MILNYVLAKKIAQHKNVIFGSKKMFKCNFLFQYCAISDYLGYLLLSWTSSGYVSFRGISAFLRLSWVLSGYTLLSHIITYYLSVSFAISGFLYQVSNIRVQVEAEESKLLLFRNFFIIFRSASSSRTRLCEKNKKKRKK